jgi:hypothetical protein
MDEFLRDFPNTDCLQDKERLKSRMMVNFEYYIVNYVILALGIYFVVSVLGNPSGGLVLAILGVLAHAAMRPNTILSTGHHLKEQFKSGVRNTTSGIQKRR